MFQMRDPDGNLLRVVQHMEEAETGRQGLAAIKRFVVLVKSDADAEAGATPDERSLAEMVAFNDELASAGLMLAGEGLHASSDGARIRFAQDAATVIHGPFPEPDQLIAGYWMIQAESLEQAIDWMTRAPMGGGAEIEIRQVFDAEEFGEAFTPELREQEERQRTRMEANAKRRAA